MRSWRPIFAIWGFGPRGKRSYLIAQLCDCARARDPKMAAISDAAHSIDTAHSEDTVLEADAVAVPADPRYIRRKILAKDDAETYENLLEAEAAEIEPDF